MSVSLFQMLLRCEEQQIGVNVKDIFGKTVLSTELNWINRFICSYEKKSAELYAQAEKPFDSWDTTMWYNFPQFIYKQIDKSSLSKVCQVALDFLEWVEKNYSEYYHTCQMAKGALHVGKKEMERLLKIYKYFNERQKNWTYLPGPTESLEDIFLNEQLTALQAPDQAEQLQDTFEMISKNLEKQLGYFKGLEKNNSVVVQLDPMLCNLLQMGDKLPLTLSLSQSGHYYLNNVGYPLPTPVAWTK